MLKKVIIAGLLALSTVTVFAKEISFGIIATDSATAQRDRWEPFFRDMEKATGLTIKSFYAPDYAGVIEAMRFNKVQVAWYGNKAAMEAVDRASGEVFAQVGYADGSWGYHALLITHKDSPYQNVDDVIKNGKNIPVLIINDWQHERIDILTWINQDFQSKPPKNPNQKTNSSIDYTPEKRCDVVAKRFQDFYECGLLQNIVQHFQPLGKKSYPGYPAIFVQLEKNDPAERKNQLQCLAQASEPRTPTSFNQNLYLLFMLNEYDPRPVNEELCSVRGFLGGDPILVDYPKDKWTASKKSQRSSPPTLSINSEPIPQPITIKTCLDNNFFLDQDTTQDTTEEDK